MNKFLREYSSVFFLALPMIHLAGKLAPAIALIVSLFVSLGFWMTKKRGPLIIFFLTILVLGDQRTEDLLFYKPIRIVVILVLAAWTISDLATKKASMAKGFLWLVPFILMSFVSLIIASPIKFLSLQKTISYTFVVLVCFQFIVPWLISKHKHFMDLIYFIGFILLVGLLNYIIRPEAVLLGNRFEGVFGNPNGLGLACMLWTPFLYAAYRNSEQRRGILFLGIFLLISLILSGSRNSLMTVCLFFGFQYVFKSRKRRRLFFWGIPVLYMIITSVDWISLIEQLGLGDYLRVQGIETASGRTLSWAFAISMIPQHFWLGAGFAYQEFVYLNLVPPELAIFREMSSTWNSYLTFMLNNGLIGLSLFIMFLLAQIRYASNRWQTFAFIFAYMLGAIFETWMSASLNSFTIYFYILLGYLQRKPFST